MAEMVELDYVWLWLPSGFHSFPYHHCWDWNIQKNLPTHLFSAWARRDVNADG